MQFISQSSSKADHKKGTISLVRGSSSSLIELPTFLTRPVKLGHLRQLGLLDQHGETNEHPCQHKHCHLHIQEDQHHTDSLNIPETLSERLANYQLKGTRDPMTEKRSQYTVIFVALGFFTTCLLMVAIMLSFTSDYQDMIIARVINTSNTNYAI